MPGMSGGRRMMRMFRVSCHPVGTGGGDVCRCAAPWCGPFQLYVLAVGGDCIYEDFLPFSVWIAMREYADSSPMPERRDSAVLPLFLMLSYRRTPDRLAQTAYMPRKRDDVTYPKMT